MRDEYLTMKELGQLFGLSSHAIGKRLKEIGLRTRGGKPSRAAFDAGMCDERWAYDLRGYCWAWAKKRTIEALERSGLRRAEAPPAQATSPTQPQPLPERPSGVD